MMNDRPISGTPIPTHALRRSGIRTALSACALFAAGMLSACHTLADERIASSQDEQRNAAAAFLAKYVAWAKLIEVQGQERGVPLTPAERRLAAEVGIARPDKVRLVYVDAVPFPADDPEMRAVGESMGFIGPGVINNAQAFGYTIWVRRGFTLDTPLLAHELVHVAQIERSASFGAYAERYMRELMEFGHTGMPLEIEAHEANRKYAAAD
ncbi:hypothetical protein [Pseudoblastomonas halimionae]|uniref:DUF4157 domain-containing protein n=1 Tax=Alteriqipengyuania halimionae TaxID=1926630 RepID=A0A6I4U7Y5_9SPHN|nr:hypothetical protein [Alteriqipengyuania halimionae]MXP10357.1 hypothetical protein [Alteriqipengyuania halimionae]